MNPGRALSAARKGQRCHLFPSPHLRHPRHRSGRRRLGSERANGFGGPGFLGAEQQRRPEELDSQFLGRGRPIVADCI